MTTRNIFLTGLIILLSFSGIAQSGWTLSIGGSASDYGYTNCVDNEGNVYSGGSFKGTVDFSPHQAGFNVTSGVESPFLMKMDSARTVEWLRVWESTAQSKIVSSCIDESGYLYVLGSFLNQIDLDPGTGVQHTPSNTKGIFVSQFDLDGNQLWAKSVEVSGNILEPTTIDVSPNGHLKITGVFDGMVDFDPGTGTNTLTSGSLGNELFILDLTVAGDFQWVDRIGGLPFATAMVRGVAAEDDGSILITGDYSSTMDFDPGPDSTILTSTANGSLFLMKLNEQGEFVWLQHLDQASGRDVAFDDSGNTILTGFFSGTLDFDFGVTNHYETSEQWDVFTLKLSNDSVFQWVNMISGTEGQFSQRLVIGENNNIYLVGTFGEEIMIDHNGFSWQSNPLTFDDSYFVSMDSTGNFIQASEIVGAGSTLVQSIACNAFNQIYLIGYYEGDIDMDMSPLWYDYHTSNGMNDVFQIKVGPVDFTGIPDLTQKQFFVYPNPAASELNLPHAGSYLIYDAVGKLQSSGVTNGQIDISQLIPGVYILEMSTNEKSKFIKL